MEALRSSCFAGSPYNRMVAALEGGALRKAADRQGGPPEKPCFLFENMAVLAFENFGGCRAALALVLRMAGESPLV